ncbi:ABC transporter ATP-binding protein [Oceanobacter kriegii]|uniref:ABC transporter ATP-binding protein n=1 Tax=Oceanobacter kriegii TaxID=64972 RepID=UPI0004290BE2|nr:ABC transporter ATP-binding protein [Oceanobacter kriegii]
MVRLDLDLKQKYYASAQQAALGEINASIPESQFVALVGPSGTGKTTLLNMIAGLEPSEPGTIKVNGQSQAQTPCQLGYIFQQPRLMPWMTVEENLRLTAPEIGQADIEAMLDIVGLQGKGAEYPRKLSGGMQKRVSIARAFLAKPDLLLLDEPFVSLDQPTAQHLRGMLENLWQQQKPTVIFVTHDLDEAIQLADRVLFLSAAPGRLILDKAVELPRPRGAIEVEEWKQGLLAEHPGVLAGR